MNEPFYYKNIGDRGVRTLEQTETYLREKLLVQPHPEYGVFLIELLDTGEVIGFSSLILRLRPRSL